MIVTIKFTEACRQGLLGEVEEEKEKGNHDYKEEYEDKNQFFLKRKKYLMNTMMMELKS